MRSVLSLPLALQAVWTAVYAAGISGEASRYRADGETSLPSADSLAGWAENHVWDAVRRANGGEMPNEQEREEGKCAVTATRPADEPTDEEMAEALAPIAAELSHGPMAWGRNEPFHETWIEYARQCLAGVENTWSGEFRQHCAIALASWKAARAWGRK